MGDRNGRMKTFLFLILCFVGTSAVNDSNETLFDIAKKYGLHDILMDLGVRAGLADKMKEPGKIHRLSLVFI